MEFFEKLKVRHRSNHPARERILERFERWLDETLEDEASLEGIDQALFSELAEETGASPRLTAGEKDLYSTWSAMTALTQEVRLQGRAFRNLTDKIEPLAGLVDSVEQISERTGDAVNESREVALEVRDLLGEREKKIGRDALGRARTEFLDLLLDVRERLHTGRGSVAEALRERPGKAGAGWFGKRSGGRKLKRHELLEIVDSLKKGYELGLERLDDALLQHGLSEISCRGEVFDPETMTAVDIEERSDMPDGTVMDVYRSGYIMGNQVYRTAQVKVSRMPKAE